MYSVLINRDAQKYVDSLTEKSRMLVKKKLEMLKDNLHPGRADKKKLQLPNYDLFRMHVRELPVNNLPILINVIDTDFTDLHRRY
uniref:Uncharacterized protein n=1 Tax=Candidatus Methanophaga sp. ANME-1 ERB7 TaxID=2759913 RepID=A0A7G9Z7K4_9EURY|nr:hypothetical protein BCGBNPPC_00022 [Methanosarcinales archaeon ANME-1 ERB7]